MFFYLEKTDKYIRSLKNMENQSLVKIDSRKTGFVAIIANIWAIKSIFDDVVVNGPMSYICTLKLSQDPLEHFFGLIRARYGANNNPTPYQFRSTFRKILMGVTDKIVTNSNVTLQDNAEMVGIIPDVTNKVDYIFEAYDLFDLDLDKFKDQEISGFKENVINYVSGFIVKKIKCKTDCYNCIKSLESGQKAGLTSLREIDQTNSKLVYASEFVVKVVKLAEQIVIGELEKNWLQKKYFFDFINIKICNAFVSLFGNIFKLMDNHSYDLMKKIVSCYVSIRFKSHAKLTNETIKKKRLRQKLTKLIIQNHQ